MASSLLCTPMPHLNIPPTTRTTSTDNRHPWNPHVRSPNRPPSLPLTTVDTTGREKSQQQQSGAVRRESGRAFSHSVAGDAGWQSSSVCVGISAEPQVPGITYGRCVKRILLSYKISILFLLPTMAVVNIEWSSWSRCYHQILGGACIRSPKGDNY